MTDEKRTLFELIQKADSTDFLKELAQTALQRLMEFQIDDMCGAGSYAGNWVTGWSGGVL